MEKEMPESKYYSRYIDKSLERKLRSSGAVLVAGPKFCGKTTTCLRYAKSVYRINTKSVVSNTKINPKIALKGKRPHLIDEWQKVPDTWNYVKEDLDIDYQFGKYILTGSSTPVDKSQVEHPGAGRIAPLKMYPMSSYESGDSEGLVSLSKLFEDKRMDEVDPNSDFGLEDAAFLVCRGGWPLSIQEDRELSLEITKNYYEGLFYFEDSENPSFRGKKSEVFKSVLKSYARNISTEAGKSIIIKDVSGNGERSVDEKTFTSYWKALKDLYILEDMEAWRPNIRSKTAILTTPTRHFVDTSIACQALGITPNDLMNDFNSFGFFFEDMAVRDLRVYAGLMGGSLRHYRDNAGLECDAIIHLPNGKWAAIEIKLGGDELIEYGANKLKLLRDKIKEKSDENAPEFLMILTAFGPLQTREDGILVVPINMLRA